MKLHKKSINISKKVQLIVCGQILLIALLFVNNYDLQGVIGDIPVSLTETGFLTPSSKGVKDIKNMTLDDGFLSPDKFGDEELLYRLASQARQDQGAQTDNDVPGYLVYAGVDSGELFTRYNENVFNIEENKDIKDFLDFIEKLDVSQMSSYLEMMNLSDLGTSEPVNFSPPGEPEYPSYGKVYNVSIDIFFQSQILSFEDVFGVSLKTYIDIPNLSVPDFIIDLPDYNSFSQQLPFLPDNVPVYFMGAEKVAFNDYNQVNKIFIGENLFIGYEEASDYTFTSGYMKFYNQYLQNGVKYSVVIGFNSEGKLKQLGGVNLTDVLLLGYNEIVDGIYTLEGGQLLAEYEVIGKKGNGTLIQTGGTNRFNSLYLAYDRCSTGDYSMENGFAQGYNMTVGVDGIGTYSQLNGTMQIDYLLTVGQNLNSDGTVAVDGGSLTTQITRVGEYGTGTVNLNNGTYESKATTLGYGLSLSKDDFENYIPEPKKIDSFWNQLVDNEYIKENGQVLNSLFLFDVQEFLDTVNLSEFTSDSDSVLDILRNNQYASSGTFIQNDGSNYTNHLILCSGKGSIGEYVLNGGDLECQYIYLGYPAQATFTQNGGTVHVFNDVVLGLCDENDEAVHVDNSDLLYGSTCEIYGGSFEVENNIIGLCDYSSLIVDGGTLTVLSKIVGVSDFFVGYTNSGSYTQTTGDYEIGNLYIGYEEGATGDYSMLFEDQLESKGNTFGNVYVGYNGTGYLNMSKSAIKVNDLYVGYNSGSTGELNIDDATNLINDYEIEAENIYVGTNDSTGTINHKQGTVRSATVTLGSDSDIGSGVYNLSAPAILETDYLNIKNTGVFNHYGSVTVNRQAFVEKGAEYYFKSGLLQLKSTMDPIGGTMYHVKSNLVIDGTFSQDDGNLLVQGDLNVSRDGTVFLKDGTVEVTDQVNNETVTAWRDLNDGEYVRSSAGNIRIAGNFEQAGGDVHANSIILESTGSYSMTLYNNEDSVVVKSNFDVEGSFNLYDGNLNIGGDLNVSGYGIFEQEDGSIEIGGDLNVSGYGIFYQYDGDLDIGGNLIVSQSAMVVLTDENRDKYTAVPAQADNKLLTTCADQKDGEKFVSNIKINGIFSQSGGQLKASTITVEKDNSLYKIAGRDCSVVIYEKFVWGEQSSCEVVNSGSLTVSLYGAVFDIYQTDSSELSGFNNINLEFFGVGNFLEAASAEILSGDGFLNNFALNSIKVNGLLTLIDFVDNQNDGAGNEIIYVRNLILGENGLINLGTTTLCYEKLFLDDIEVELENIDGKYFNGQLQQIYPLPPIALPVPEPSVYLSFFFGFLLLFSSVNKKYLRR